MAANREEDNGGPSGEEELEYLGFHVTILIPSFIPLSSAPLLSGECAGGLNGVTALPEVTGGQGANWGPTSRPRSDWSIPTG